MRTSLFALVVAANLVPMAASAADDAQPKFPPGFDCSAVAAGSQRQACNRSQLNPPMGSIPETTSTRPNTIVPPVDARKLPTDRPSTIPRLPGTIDTGN